MCGATSVEDLSTEGIDVAGSTLIQGRVTRGGDPVAGAYVRLLDTGGEFTAEVVTSVNGAYRFFARPGDWTLRVLAPGGAEGADVTVAAEQGQVNGADIQLS
jgi:hypothetical protein